MTKDEVADVAERMRAQITKIEAEAMNDQPGWREYLARLSEEGRESALKAVLDRQTFERWRVLKMALAEPDRL